MYYEDDFYNQMDIDNLSANSQPGKVNKLFNDKHCHRIARGKQSIKVFSSGEIGSHIRNAVTGSFYGRDKIVGSPMEDLYFRVSHPFGNERSKLFFDSPDQYERHFGYNIDADVQNGENIKTEWRNRKMAKLMLVTNS